MVYKGGRGQAILISRACFSGGWESPCWSLVAAAGVNQRAVSMAEAGSEAYRGGHSPIAEHAHDLELSHRVLLRSTIMGAVVNNTLKVWPRRSSRPLRRPSRTKSERHLRMDSSMDRTYIQVGTCNLYPLHCRQAPLSPPQFADGYATTSNPCSDISNCRPHDLFYCFC
jgi:hypothetical protein